MRASVTAQTVDSMSRSSSLKQLSRPWRRQNGHPVGAAYVPGHIRVTGTEVSGIIADAAGAEVGIVVITGTALEVVTPGCAVMADMTESVTGEKGPGIETAATPTAGAGSTGSVTGTGTATGTAGTAGRATDEMGGEMVQTGIGTDGLAPIKGPAASEAGSLSAGNISTAVRTSSKHTTLVAVGFRRHRQFRAQAITALLALVAAAIRAQVLQSPHLGGTAACRMSSVVLVVLYSPPDHPQLAAASPLARLLLCLPGPSQLLSARNTNRQMVQLTSLLLLSLLAPDYMSFGGSPCTCR